METDHKLAVIAAHLRPAQGFGGVAESTAELIGGWRAAGRSVLVAVSDGSAVGRVSQADFVRELQVPVYVYRAMAAVRWGFGPGAPRAIFRAVRQAQAVYISGIATWPATIGAYVAWALRKPYIVAVRGGLMPEHWQEIRASRPLKHFFYRTVVFPALRQARAVHVSSEIEAVGVRSVLPSVALVVAPNAFQPPSAELRALRAPSHDGLRLLYLGRLSAEKGILGFARAFASARGPADVLTLVGPAEGQYAAELVKLCASTPGLEYAGVVKRADVSKAISQADALVLPSGVDGDVRENFGNVVVEALLHGRPALVTEGLAWDALEPAKVGVVFDRELVNLPAKLQQLRSLLDEDLPSRCREFAVERYSVSKVSQTLWHAAFGGIDAATERARRRRS